MTGDANLIHEMPEKVTGSPKHQYPVVIFAVGIALAVAATLLLAAGDTQAETVTVPAGNRWYCDASFDGGICETTIVVGDTVTWEMVEGFHTVTECDDTFSSCPPAGGGFGSAILSSGQTFSHTFTEPDTVEYLCTLHPVEMRGRIIVQEPTPTPGPPSATPSPAPVLTSTPGKTPAPAATTQPSGLPLTGAETGVGNAGVAWWMPLAGVVLILMGTALFRRRTRS